jgi:hypothetical protein
MNNPTPRFTGIFIPVEVLEHPELTMLEQLLLSWIDALYCKSHKGCYAKNEYFAQRLKVKENTVAKALTSLRQKKLIEDVSFDGRNRILRAKVGEYVEKAQSKAGLDLNPRQGWTEIQGSIGFLSIPTYIESKEEIKEDITPPIPPLPNEVVPAKAGEMELDKSSSKPKREKPDFPPKVRDLANQMVNSLIRTKPDYVPPKNLSALLTEIDFILRLDGRDAIKVMDVFNWALADSFWADKMFKPNPAKYLREKFDQLEMKMNAKPEKKDRKFAASSDDKKALEKIQGMRETAL